jgi:hypothetical protein
MLHFLLYRVPCEKPIDQAQIEAARKHCRMTPERLAVLRAPPHDRHWRRMLQRRAVRLAYFKQHGKLLPPGTRLLPDEQDHSAQIDGFRRYRKGGLAKLKARLRKRPEAAHARLERRYIALKHFRSESRKNASLNDILARLLANQQAASGELTLAEFEKLRSVMRPNKRWWKWYKRQQSTMDKEGE